MAFLVVSTMVCSCDTARNVDPPYSQYFLKYYGEDGDQEAVDMVVNPDGTFILLSKSTDVQTILLVKTDGDGNIIWQRKLGTSTDEPKDIELTLDGDYVILSDFLMSTNNTDIKILRVDNNGNKIDSATNGTTANDFGKSITPVSDGGFIIGGSTASVPNTNLSFLHYRCNANLVFSQGNWRDIYDTELPGSINEVIKVFQSEDNFFNVFGYSNTPSLGGGRTLYYYTIDDVGENAGVSFISDFTSDVKVSFVVETPLILSPGYFAIGASNKNGISKLHVSKLRDPLQFSNNDVQLNLDVAPIRRMTGICAAPSLTSPIGYLVASTESKSTGETDVVLTKIDQKGAELWSVNFGSEKNDKAAAIAELPDGRIMVLCTIESALQSKMALLKLNVKGKLLN